MAMSRALLLKSGVVSDVGSIAVLVTLCGIVGPVGSSTTLVRRTGWGMFLFERPAWAHITTRPDAPPRGPRSGEE